MHFECADHLDNSAEARFLVPIKRIIHDYITCNFIFGADYELGDEDSLLDAGIVSPVSMLQMAEFLQATFAINIPHSDINANNFGTINRLAHFVAGRIALASVA